MPSFSHSLNHSPISHLSGPQFLHGTIYALLVKRKCLYDGSNTVLCRELQHLTVQPWRRWQAALDVDRVHDQIHVREAQLRRVDRHGADGAAAPDERNHARPVGLLSASEEQAVDCPGWLGRVRRA